jgi:hypothetical protein
MPRRDLHGLLVQVPNSSVWKITLDRGLAIKRSKFLCNIPGGVKNSDGSKEFPRAGFSSTLMGSVDV